MQSIILNGTMVFVEYVLYFVNGDRNIPLAYSVYDRSEIMVRGFLANTMKGAARYSEGQETVTFVPMPDTESYVGRLVEGMERFCHGIAVSKAVGDNYIVSRISEMEEDIYAYLMNRFQLPLLKEWISYLVREGKDYFEVRNVEVLGKPQFGFKEYRVIIISIEQSELAELISNGLKTSQIRIGNSEQRKLEFVGLDEYFAKYGHTIVDNLKRVLNPLAPLHSRVDEAALLHKRLYPQQSAVVNGMVELLQSSNYGIMNCGCGTGKTIMGCVTVEAFFYRKYLKIHGKKTLKDAYSDPEAVKYRNLVMCPSHLVDKWKREIEEEIPYVKVTVIESLKELDKLQRKGKERTGKEFFILSKDKGKLSYSLYPQPYQVKRHKNHLYSCTQCRKITPFYPKEPCSCGASEWHDHKTEYYATGLVCPECGQLLYPANKKIILSEERGNRTPALMPENFTAMTDANKECCWCHAKLWMPACDPKDSIFSRRKRKAPKWVRISHYANKAKRRTKTVWVLKRRLQEYLAENELEEDEISYCNIYGPRRYAPATYIKKKLKGYFDFVIIDELHELKGGATAQGIAMHALVKATKKQIGLTGTIAGGYANHIFYLLFRFDPAMMIQKGFTYGTAGELKFTELYGTLEKQYECIESDGQYNTVSRGRMIGSPKCRPGISPLIFSDFLLGKAVFLDLPDMSRYLPNYQEIVRIVPLEKEIAQEYDRVTSDLKKMMRMHEGKTVLSSYLQFALSYTDKPYDRRPIVSALDGSILSEPENFRGLIENGELLNKEQCLVDLVNDELGEGRNVYIYCEYTGEPDSNVTHRLKEILEKNCVLARGKTAILESQSPQATEREAWMHKKAEEGYRVFITNPKCVQTGIDLIFYVNGVKYNYPTLIFYQMGYNLFVIWQASRRAYRLIQTEECRTYYLASEHTIQVEVIRMIAEKQAATAAIQGSDFSAEGLSAMASGIDPRIRLANAIASESNDTEDSIQSMFDVLRQKDFTQENISYEPMLTFYELLGRSPQEIEDFGDIISIPLLKKGALEDEILEFVFGENPSRQENEQIIDLGEEDYREMPEDTFSKDDTENSTSRKSGKTEKPAGIKEDNLEKQEATDEMDDAMLEILGLDLDSVVIQRVSKKEIKKNKKKPVNMQITILDLFSA